MQQTPRVEAKVGPQTRAELEALHLSRTELHGQLANVHQMRTQLLQQLGLTDQGPAKAEMQKRLDALNTRTGRLEAQLLATDDAISAAIARGVAGSADIATPLPPPPPPPGSPGTEQVVGVPDHVFHDVVNQTGEAVATGTAVAVFSFMVLSVFFYRMARKRTSKLFESLAADQARRFEQLQQAIDVVAVETERISEGQRFVNKRVNELGAGEAQPVGVPRSAPDAIRRDQR